MRSFKKKDQEGPMKNLRKCLFLSISMIVNGHALDNPGDNQRVTKIESESDKVFVERIAKNEKVLNGQTARTKKLIEGKEVLIAFTNEMFDPSSPNDNAYNVIVNVLVAESDNKYIWLRSEVCEVEGGTPELEAFFYFDSDKNKKDEIGVICKWPEHQAADCNIGRQARLFSLPENIVSGQINEIKNKNYTKLLYRDEKSKSSPSMNCSVANFTNVKDVKSIFSKTK